MANPKAQAAKENGNVAFKSGDYPSAIGHYTTAILADKNDVTYPLNRAAAYLKLGKNEDAERDSTQVLELSPSNVKALFRRSQARTGMGNFAGAHNDLLKVLQIDPSNQSAQEELKKVTSLVEKEKSKKPHRVPVQSPLDSSLANKRRRVPIKIIEPPSAAALTISSTVPVPGPLKPQESRVLESSSRVVPPELSNSKTDTLELVSSRSLKLPASLGDSKASLTTEKGLSDKNPPSKVKIDPYVLHPPIPTLPQPVKSTNGTPKLNSFKDAKQVRETAKPSRVGGGIFHASGSATIFTSRENGEATFSDPPKSDLSTSSLPIGLSVKDNSKGSYMPVPKAPNTLFDFVKSWSSLDSTEEKWQLINSIPPTHFPVLCKTSLEPSTLVSIMKTFLTMLEGNSQVNTVVREYMENFARIPRFNTLVLFLNKSERALAKSIWTAVGVDQPTGIWSGVV